MLQNRCLALLAVLFTLSLCAVNKNEPGAKFTFNGMKDYDEVSRQKAKLVGIHHTTDRFGNPDNAIFLSGNESSYINLGTYSALKQKAGSISLWVNVEDPIPSGKGVLYNPIIVTKCTNLDDYYEAYGIYYMLETKKIVAVTFKDSTREVCVFSRNPFQRNLWQHFVITYDYNYFCFYLNGKLENKLSKNFETAFLAGDSVIVGGTANKKNNRWLNGSVDDIAFYDRVLSEKEVLELYHAPNPNRSRTILSWVLAGLGLAVIIALVYFITRRQLKKGIIKEKQKLELNNKLLETELRVNRALMNPHFVFNSLNSLQNFIMEQDYLQANKYLVKFSKLMRRILESNMSNIISLELEIELIERYLEIENLRFEEHINYSLQTDPEIIVSAVYIPVMMLQPFIENAIWHGLLKKTGEKKLRVVLSQIGEKYIQCIIEDNGAGRKQADSSDTKNKSLATLFVIQRLELLNKIHGLSCTLAIEDKPNGQGTIVKILLPVLKNNT